MDGPRSLPRVWLASLAPHLSFDGARFVSVAGLLFARLGLLVIAFPELLALNVEDQLCQFLPEQGVHSYELDGHPVELGQVRSLLLDFPRAYDPPLENNRFEGGNPDIDIQLEIRGKGLDHAESHPASTEVERRALHLPGLRCSLPARCFVRALLH